MTAPIHPLRARLRRGWPLERVLFTMAGGVVLVSLVLAVLVSPWFLLLTAFVGLNQWAYVAFGACPSSLLLARAFGFRKGCVQ